MSKESSKKDPGLILIPQKHGGAIVNSVKGHSGNPNGRPRKLVSHLNKQLADAGVEPVTINQITDLLMRTLNLDQKQIKELVQNTDTPMVYRLLLKDLVSGDSARVRDFLFDRAFGKATQRAELTGANGDPLIPAKPRTVQITVVRQKDGENGG